MRQALGLLLAGATLTFGVLESARAEETSPLPTTVAARAHLIYRTAPQARPIEGEATVLQPPDCAQAQAASRACPSGPDTGARILILALQQR